jgi:Flp pilus assembly protein protease CpaA
MAAVWRRLIFLHIVSTAAAQQLQTRTASSSFVVTMLALDLFVLHRRAHEVSPREAGVWSAVWVAIGLGFGVLLWA